MPALMELLVAIAQGEVVRDGPGQYQWAAGNVGMRLRRLRDLDLIALPMAGPPRLLDRGQVVVSGTLAVYAQHHRPSGANTDLSSTSTTSGSEANGDPPMTTMR